MERRKAERLGDVLSRYLAQSGLQSPLNEYRLVQSWGKVAGDAVERRTKKVSIRAGKLLVTLDSPALRADLMMRRSDLVKRLNAEVGAQVVTDISFL